MSGVAGIPIEVRGVIQEKLEESDASFNMALVESYLRIWQKPPPGINEVEPRFMSGGFYMRLLDCVGSLFKSETEGEEFSKLEQELEIEIINSLREKPRYQVNESGQVWIGQFKVPGKLLEALALSLE